MDHGAYCADIDLVEKYIYVNLAPKSKSFGDTECRSVEVHHMHAWDALISIQSHSARPKEIRNHRRMVVVGDGLRRNGTAKGDKSFFFFGWNARNAPITADSLIISATHRRLFSILTV